MYVCILLGILTINYLCDKVYHFFRGDEGLLQGVGIDIISAVVFAGLTHFLQVGIETAILLGDDARLDEIIAEKNMGTLMAADLMTVTDKQGTHRME